MEGYGKDTSDRGMNFYAKFMITLMIGAPLSIVVLGILISVFNKLV